MDGNSLLEGKNNVHVLKQTENSRIENRTEVKEEEGGAVKEVRRTPGWFELWPQVLVSCGVLTTSIQAGVALAYSATLIPQLAADPTIANFTKTQASWIASLPAVSTPVGALVVGPLMEMTGRRISLVISCLAVVISWIITYFTSHHLWTLYLARLFMGFGGGMGTAAVVYVSEVSCCWVRPSLLCLNSVAVAGGILISTGLGWAPWRPAALGLAFLALLALIFCYLVPESPTWLMAHRGPHPARKVLEWLNRTPWLLEEEWERLEESVGLQGNKREEGKKKGMLQELWKREALLPLRLLLGLFVLQQFSGVYVIIFYAATLFQSVGGDFGLGLDQWGATLLLGVIRFGVSVLAAGLSTRVGRRSLMVWSGSGVALSWLLGAGALWLGGSGGGLHLRAAPVGLPLWVRWASLLSLLSGVGFGALGFMVIPWALIGELLPPRARGPASGLVVSFAYVLMFCVTKTFPFLLEYVSLAAVLLGYSIVSALTVVYVLLYLPETFGKSFQQIADAFH